MKKHIAAIAYRPDITGLRAVAVLAVIGFHVFPNRLPGGFIGVDIFFVISGFLISSIILDNLDKSTFSFAEFYARRIRRIFPALILVLAASYAFGWFTLLADEYAQLGKHIAGGAGFVSNFVLWSESGYFDNSAETKPLLHLWSLGVEEQFYIVWPLLLFLAARKKRLSLIVIVLGVLASFFVNIATTGNHPVAAFFSPLTRFWELLCGGLLGWATLYAAKSGRVFAEAASVAGFGLLAFGLWSIGSGARFPGWWALIPVLGTVLIIHAGSQAWLNRAVLSNPIAIWFGQISYPLYLWHWPLLSYAKILEGALLGRGLKICLILAAIVLAWATYRLIERPVQSSPRLKARALVLLALMLCVGLAGFGTYRSGGLDARGVVADNPAIARHGYDGGDGGYLSEGCGAGFEASRLFDVCRKDRRGNVIFALMGDSKALALSTGLVRASTAAGRWMVVVGDGDKAPVPVISMNPAFASYQQPANIAIDAIAQDKSIRIVVLATAIRELFRLDDGLQNGVRESYDYKYLRNLESTQLYDAVHAGMKQAISRFVAAGKKVVILVDNPPLPESRDCVGRKTSSRILNEILGMDGTKSNPDCQVPLQAFNRSIAVYRRLLAELESEFPASLHIFDATGIYCDESSGLCGPSRDGRLLYAYTDHISDYAAGLVGRRLNGYLLSELH